MDGESLALCVPKMFAIIAIGAIRVVLQNFILAQWVLPFSLVNVQPPRPPSQIPITTAFNPNVKSEYVRPQWGWFSNCCLCL